MKKIKSLFVFFNNIWKECVNFSADFNSRSVIATYGTDPAINPDNRHKEKNCCCNCRYRKN